MQSLFRWEPVAKGHVRQVQLGSRNVTMETLAVRPGLFLIPNFMTDTETRELLGSAQTAGFKPSKVGFDIAEKKRDTSIRTSESAFLSSTMVPTSAQATLLAQLSALTKLPLFLVGRSERVQVVKYDRLQYHRLHRDNAGAAGSRYITLLVILKQARKGGETCFPFADNFHPTGEPDATAVEQLRDKCTGLKVRPPAGSALLWYNSQVANGRLGSIENVSYHASCPVKKGSKVAANIWVHADLAALDAFGSIVVKFNASKEVDDYLLDEHFLGEEGHGILIFVYGKGRHQHVLDELNRAAAGWVDSFERKGKVAPLKFASAAISGGGGGIVCKLDRPGGMSLPLACLVSAGSDGGMQQRLMPQQGHDFSVERLFSFIREWRLEQKKRKPGIRERQALRRTSSGDL